MNTADLLTDAFGRIREEVHQAVDNLSREDLAFRAAPDANSIAWLVWHLTRVQDDHVAAAAGMEQVWTAKGWADRFGLPFDQRETGYGHNTSQVTDVQTDAELLADYYDAVHEQTLRYVATLTDEDLDRVVDTSWDPPVTLGVRLVSVIADDLEHAGTAMFVRGIVSSR